MNDDYDSEDLMIVFHGKVHDVFAASLARLDVLADIDWFEAHPGVVKRDRPASPREIRAFGELPGSRVIVRLQPDGGVMRAFYTERPRHA